MKRGKRMDSLLVNTGCVPDYAYAGALVILGFLVWRVVRTRVRTGASG